LSEDVPCKELIRNGKVAGKKKNKNKERGRRKGRGEDEWTGAQVEWERRRGQVLETNFTMK
jgi:hypothetical protein